jgi:hypothetical protein
MGGVKTVADVPHQRFLECSGQCTELLRAKLQEKDGCDQVKAEHDTVELLKSIKDCVFEFSDQKKAAHSLHEALRKFHNTSETIFRTDLGWSKTKDPIRQLN